MLQNNPVVTKIRSSLVKRTISDLKKIDKDRESYEKFWENFGPVLKEGICEDFERKDSILEISLFKNSKSKNLSH